MNTDQPGPTPTEIALQQQSNTLKIDFDDSSSFEPPGRYLRTFSPAAEPRRKREN
ncbi:MAG: gamma-butyrobetaine hydroxylase-like domain-containing protein [Acidiferrobacterales bacterium]